MMCSRRDLIFPPRRLPYTSRARVLTRTAHVQTKTHTQNKCTHCMYVLSDPGTSGARCVLPGGADLSILPGVRGMKLLQSKYDIIYACTWRRCSSSSLRSFVSSGSYLLFCPDTTSSTTVVCPAANDVMQSTYIFLVDQQ